jgi:hypothetical protein
MQILLDLHFVPPYPARALAGALYGSSLSLTSSGTESSIPVIPVMSTGVTSRLSVSSRRGSGYIALPY